MADLETGPIRDKQKYDGDVLYLNPTTELYEWLDDPQVAALYGLVPSVPGGRFAYQDPDYAAGIIVGPNPLAVQDDENTSGLFLLAGAPVYEDPDNPGYLIIKEQ